LREEKKIGLWHWQLDTTNEVTKANEALEENLSSLSNPDGVESTFATSRYTKPGTRNTSQGDCSVHLTFSLRYIVL
jgi:hypothetical protein